MQSYYCVDISKGYFGIGHYISFDPDYQEKLLSIVDILRNYILRKNDFGRPFNIYIVANPGSGKSYLVKQITKSLNKCIKNIEINYFAYNLSTYDSFEELIHIFQTIQSSNIEGKFPVVFIDEIDSKLSDDHSVFKKLLSPLFDGKFYCNGMEHFLGNAIFFFASSTGFSQYSSNKSSISTIGKKIVEKGKKIVKHNNESIFNSWEKQKNEEYHTFRDLVKSNKNFLDLIPEKFIDFLDRIDQLIFIPSLNIYPSNYKIKHSQFIVASILKKLCPDIMYIEKPAILILQSLLIDRESYRVIDSEIIKSTPPLDGFFYTTNLSPELLSNPSIKWEKIIKSYCGDWIKILSSDINDELLPDILIKF